MPVNIKGKEYYTVVERMQQLIRDVKLDYSLTTEMLICDDKKVVVKATLTFKGNEYSGLAMELIGGNFINEFSALENCETSAIGRALSSAGYFGSEFCSANELENAILNQKSSNKVEDSVVEHVKKVFKVTDKDIQDAEPKTPITFGKHKGSSWEDAPKSYVEWAAKNLTNENYKKQALDELNKRNNGYTPEVVSDIMQEQASEEIPF
tara:strand:+ start:2867 stop:3490 length:624 start_codon:yes stop_codon:yes gene_type:complete